MSEMSEPRYGGESHTIAELLRDQAILQDQDMADQLQRCADLCEDYAFDLNRTSVFD